MPLPPWLQSTRPREPPLRHAYCSSLPAAQAPAAQTPQPPAAEDAAPSDADADLSDAEPWEAAAAQDPAAAGLGAAAAAAAGSTLFGLPPVMSASRGSLGRGRLALGPPADAEAKLPEGGAGVEGEGGGAAAGAEAMREVRQMGQVKLDCPAVDSQPLRQWRWNRWPHGSTLAVCTNRRQHRRQPAPEQHRKQGFVAKQHVECTWGRAHASSIGDSLGTCA